MFAGNSLKLKSNLILFSMLLGIYGMAYFIQTHIFFNYDVAWLLEASRRMWNGGTYSKNFFENNPPFILYFYSPVVLLHLFFKSINLLFQLYVFGLSGLSLFLIYYFLQQIFNDQIKQVQLLMVAFAILFLIMPIFQFGQREHLLFVLITPYLLMTACRLQGQIPPFTYVIATGILGSMGFLLKPYFLICLLLVEIYFLIRKKNYLAWLRTDIVIIISITVCYLIIVCARHADYLQIVMPFAMRWCYLGSKLPFKMLILDPHILFSVLGILVPFVIPKKNPYTDLAKLFCVAIFSCLIIFFLQKTLYFYHMLPSLFLATINFVLLLCGISYPTYQYRVFDYLKFIFFGTAAFSLIYYFYPSLWTVLVFNPAGYFIYFGLICFILFYFLHSTSFFNTMIIIAIILGVSYVFFYMSYRVSNHYFSLTTFLILLLFCLFLSYKNPHQKNKLFVTSVLAISIFVIPFHTGYVEYKNRISSKEDLKPLTDFINKLDPKRTLYFFSTHSILWSFEYQNIRYPSRFEAFWMLPALVKAPYLDSSLKNPQLIKDKNFLIDMIAEDIEQQKPDFVLVGVESIKHNFFLLNQKNKLIPLPFNYLDYFLTNKRFKSVWENYYYVSTIENNRLFSIIQFKYRLYARK